MALPLFFLIFFLPQDVQREINHEKLIVWNVGQGLWITRVSATACEHTDMGGEFAPFSRLQKLCAGKMNRLFLSHWDSDHSRFIPRFQKRISTLCLVDAPPQPKKLRRAIGLPRCSQPSWRQKVIWQGAAKGPQNDQSHVSFDSRFSALFPGDSPSSQEKRWSTKAPLDTQILILGHHGSRTSTSRRLLMRLLNLKMAIASARFKKYGHPHIETKKRLQQAHIGLLKTEDWGNLIFYR